MTIVFFQIHPKNTQIRDFMWKIKSHFYVKPRVNLILLNGAELLISKCGCYIRISCIP